METLIKFKELGLSDTLLLALKSKGFETPTPIQEKIIPLVLEGKQDIIGQAQTGTGKTAAFGLPILQTIQANSGHIKAMILVPTRELAIQVAEEINSLKGKQKVNVLPIYGGQSIELQLSHLRRNVDIVVGTPGRVMDLMRRKKIILERLEYFILDEADEMLNMGFVEDIELILSVTNLDKRILLFSATMPDAIRNIARKYMRDTVNISVNRNQLATELTEQIYFEVNHADKLDALCRIIDTEPGFYGIVFCRTKNDTDDIAAKLFERGYNSEALHGDISQAQREKILKKFKKKTINILVATDVAARGIDVTDISHVINYSLPQDPESYIHRIGRTGRAGKKGTAITFISPSEYRGLVYIQNKTKSTISKKKIPRMADVLAIKKARIKHEIKGILDKQDQKIYVELANELLSQEGASPAAVVAALILHAYKDEFQDSDLKETLDASVDGKGKCRLFVAFGKIDGMSPGKLVSFLAEKVLIEPYLIKDAKVYDKYSFITVPFIEAEKIIEAFKKGDGRRNHPLIEIAKDRT